MCAMWSQREIMTRRNVGEMHSYQSIPSGTAIKRKLAVFDEETRHPLTKLSVLAPVLVTATITLASIFYKLYHDWDISTCVYYACQTLIGVLYGVPEETDRISQMFSLFLYFLGSTYIYAAIAAYANIITERAVASSKDVARMEQVKDLNNDGVLCCWEWMVFLYNRILTAMNWNENKYAIITVSATLSWLILGIVYGVVAEGYDLYTAVYFALGAMMLAGSVAPPCHGDPSHCSLGTPRAVFMAIYLIVGSPMFILTMGQFYEALITKAQTARQRSKYLHRFTPEEFEFAAEILRSTEPSADVERDYIRSVNFSEFALLELLRTDVVNSDEINHLRDLFHTIDADASGRVDYFEMQVMSK